MTGILAVDVEVRRGDAFTLDAALTVAPGEVLALLGPNGAGKTTLLRAVAGLEPCSRGRIAVGPVALDDVGLSVRVPTERRRVGFVFQTYRLFPHLSVRDNVAFAARSAGVRRHAARRRAQPWLERLGLADLADRRPGRLSGGQAQRVALARALASDPDVLLLDEPLAALDARTRLAVRGELRRHVVSFPGPTVVVTHDALEAMVLADRVCVLERGRVVQTGRPADLARRPATGYVASLVGLNLYRGRLTARDTVELDGGGRLVIPAPPEGTADGGRVLVAVRPSAVALHDAHPGAGSPRNVWPARVDGLEPLVDRVRVHLAGAPPALVDVTAAAIVDLRLVQGSEVWLAVKATELEVYPEPPR